jgi:hypothetical protein
MTTMRQLSSLVFGVSTQTASTTDAPADRRVEEDQPEICVAASIQSRVMRRALRDGPGDDALANPVPFRDTCSI